MIEITAEDLIELIKKCVVHFVWKSEQCFFIFSDEDEEEIENIIDERIEL